MLQGGEIYGKMHYKTIVIHRGCIIL